MNDIMNEMQDFDENKSEDSDRDLRLRNRVRRMELTARYGVCMDDTEGVLRALRGSALVAGAGSA